MEKFIATEKTTVKRLPKRGEYDRAAVYQILDEAFLCHVGFAVDGQPFVIPTGYARIADKLYIHGSPASRMLRSLAESIEVCVTVTLLDGLVLARSAFHHSMNYRSVVVFGTAQIVEAEAEKFEALRLFTEHIVPNRWNEIREPTAKELKGTTVLKLPITEASAKIRTGDPVDDAEDYDLNVWAGVIPLKIIAEKPINDALLNDGITQPEYALNYKR